MGFSDSMNYLMIGNPVSQSLLNAGSSALKVVSKSSKSTSAIARPIADPVANNLSLWKISGSSHNFVRLAGISGLTAIVAASIASHHKEKDGKWDDVFEKANRFHLFHTIALLGCPLARKPLLTGSLLTIGTILFSGSLYYKSFTGKSPPIKNAAPTGGLLLILGWASFML